MQSAFDDFPNFLLSMKHLGKWNPMWRHRGYTQRAHGFIFQLSSVVTDRLHLHPPASVGGGPLAVSQLENGSPALVILIYIHGHVRSLSPPP